MKKCWNCGKQIPGVWLFCNHTPLKSGCGKIQPPGLCVTYFDVLAPAHHLKEGFERDGGEELNAERDSIATKPLFRVDETKLRNRFLKLQQQIHPDSFATKDHQEKKISDMQSTYINKGYETLRNPLKRANYILKLYGKHTTEAESIQDPELLSEVLEVMEAVSEASSEDLETLEKENNERILRLMEKLEIAFEEHELEEARDLTIQMRYWMNIADRLKELNY
ncbi:hypothetical protein HK098_007181 [Nowakowskiella sp. JEL0407]|nr:hypothetical protein HK098_007181 [Nowakowskiella sp. JEL0407]